MTSSPGVCHVTVLPAAAAYGQLLAKLSSIDRTKVGEILTVWGGALRGADAVEPVADAAAAGISGTSGRVRPVTSRHSLPRLRDAALSLALQTAAVRFDEWYDAPTQIGH